MKTRLLAFAALLTAALGCAADPVLDAAAKEAGAQVTPSGLVFRSLKEGTGASTTAPGRAVATQSMVISSSDPLPSRTS